MSSKGGQQTTTVELPDEIKQASLDNLELAKKVGQLPYAPYFGASVAGFTPGQDAAFANMNNAASAFGLQGAAGQGMPTGVMNVGGINGYSTEGAYNSAMSQVDPAVLALYNQFFGKQNPVTNGGGGGGGGKKNSGATDYGDPTYGGQQYNFGSPGSGK